MTAIAASTRRHAAAATLHLPFKVPAKDWFSLKETATLIGMRESFAEKLYDQGKISGHAHNAGTGKRDTKRIPRMWVVSYLIRTAEYSDPDLADAFISGLHTFSTEQLLALRSAIFAELNRR